MKYPVRWIGLLLILASFLAPAVSAAGDQPQIPKPPPNGAYVLDQLDWLTPQQETEINTIVDKLSKEQRAQIAVVTLNDCGADKQKFRNDLFRNWGVGHKNDNDGLLAMVCWYGGDKSQRSLEQEVGYGLEATLPDVLTSKIAKQYFVPAFSTGASDSEVIKSGKAGDALVAVVKAYDGIIRGNIPAELKDQPAQPVNGWVVLFWTIIGIVLFWGILAVLSRGSGGSSSSGGSSDSSGSFLGGLVGGSILSGSDSSSSDSDSSDDDDSSSSSGSSFGGFGGGSSGGGGSSTGF